jgi:hypothetical protein
MKRFPTIGAITDGVRPAYRVPEQFEMFEADPDGAAKEEVAKNL